MAAHAGPKANEGGYHAGAPTAEPRGNATAHGPTVKGGGFARPAGPAAKTRAEVRARGGINTAGGRAAARNAAFERVGQKPPVPQSVMSRSQRKLANAPVPQRGAPAPKTAGDHFKGAAKGTAGVGFKVAKSSPAIPVMLLVAFTVIAIANLRGQAKLDVHKALFGGFILAFLLLLLNMAAPQVAVGFAALVMVGVLIEFGPTALGGLIGKGKSATLPGGVGNTVSADNVFAQAQAANGGHGSPGFAPGVYGGTNYTNSGAWQNDPALNTPL